MLLDRNSFAAEFACIRGFAVIGPDTAIIPLGRGLMGAGHKGYRLTDEFALVSREDVHLGRFYWSKSRWGYARRRTPEGRTILLHRELMGCVLDDGLVIDHINRVKLDCRRPNLRLVTQAQNAQNQGSRGRTSSHRGVSFKARDGKWVVNHKLDGKHVYLGAYDDEETAAGVARAWRAKHMTHAMD
jgi:hypothetical protein